MSSPMGYTLGLRGLCQKRRFGLPKVLSRLYTGKREYGGLGWCRPVYKGFLGGLFPVILVKSRIFPVIPVRKVSDHGVIP